ncbi:MAG: ABC transporter ATP-binding protein/permease [Defluviitaleaceae bacterium]|nr:ABC transporter ATP-binding protein/permease [Defluviitaleaceae bacterium]
MQKLKDNFLSIKWAFKLARRINIRVYLWWSSISILLAVLPAVSLHFNREALAVLSGFVATGQGSFGDVLPSIVALGVILTAIGLSNRVNGDFLNMQMHDTYYFGFLEFYMDTVQDVELKTLMDKRYLDEHYSALGRGGSLSDFMSNSCVLLAKSIGAASLLVVAAQVSLVIFLAAAGYIAAIMLLNYVMVDKLRWNHLEYDEARRLAAYYENSSMQPGVAKEMRIYDTSKETVDKWADAYKEVEDFIYHHSRFYPASTAISRIGFYLFIVGMMAYGIFQVAAGSMTVDVFLMVFALGVSISEMIGSISNSFVRADNAMYFLNIQRKFTGAVPRAAQDWRDGFEPADHENIFQAKNLCFSYDDEKQVLHDLTFSIKKGETVALVGLNGSGKSTLVKLLIGLFSPTKGDLRFYGKEYDDKTRGGVIKRVGMFFQDFHIFHATFRENVGFGDLKNLNDEAQIMKAIEKGDAKKILDNLSNGLEQWLTKHVKSDGIWLSGGESQRVAVSRTHMSDKDVLIFDEPASALDPVAEMNQFQAIREKIQGRTAILISHRVGFARLADRIIVLQDGRLAEDGTHETLMQKDGIYANFFNTQAEWYQKGGEAVE